MSDIDWSKAPEGATHWANYEGVVSKWHKLKNGELYFYDPDATSWECYGSDFYQFQSVVKSLN